MAKRWSTFDDDEDHLFLALAFEKILHFCSAIFFVLLCLVPSLSYEFYLHKQSSKASCKDQANKGTTDER